MLQLSLALTAPTHKGMARLSVNVLGVSTRFKTENETLLAV